MPKKVTTEIFIEKARVVHDDKYDYGSTEYKNASTKVKIICPIHGVFEQQPRAHLTGQGCPECGKTKNGIKKKLSLENFIERSKNNHKIKYDYSKVSFNNLHEVINIVCPLHGDFFQEANNHLRGQDCPKCIAEQKDSKGVREIEAFLVKNNIKYKREQKFKKCKNKRELPFDFYLPEKNLLIEYDGSQHFYPKFKEENLTKIQFNDKIKNRFCEENKIRLVRINFKENKDIEKILLKEIYGKNNFY